VSSFFERVDKSEISAADRVYVLSECEEGMRSLSRFNLIYAFWKGTVSSQAVFYKPAGQPVPNGRDNLQCQHDAESDPIAHRRISTRCSHRPAADDSADSPLDRKGRDKHQQINCCAGACVQACGEILGKYGVVYGSSLRLTFVRSLSVPGTTK